MKRLITILALIIIASPLWGAVTGVSGTLTHGSSVTISGTGFGTKSHASPLMYDPVDGMYASITEGAAVPVGGTNPWAVNSEGLDRVTFTLTRPRGKISAKYSNRTVLNDNYGGAWTNGWATLAADPDGWSSCVGGRMYVSYWAYPATDPGPGVSSNKFLRFLDANTNQNNYSTQFVFAPDVSSIWLEANTLYTTIWTAWGGSTAAWNRFEILVDNTTNPKPTATVRTNLSQRFSTQSNYNASADVSYIYVLGADWSTSSTPGPQLEWGEVYVDDTLTRVEIGDASAWASCTHREIQPATVWNANGQSITITLNQGSFSDSSTAYLYILDSTGTPLDQDAGTAGIQGYEITFGEAGEPAPAPPTISNVTISNGRVQ